MIDLPPHIKEKLNDLQIYQQQGEMIVAQRVNIETELYKVDEALATLQVSADNVQVFKRCGDIYFTSNKKTLLKEMLDRRELLDLKLKTITNQENRIRVRFTQLQEQLKKLLLNQNT
jgi:prefoldin beta subunit